MKIWVIFILLVISRSATADTPCWADPDTVPEHFSTEAQLKTFLLPINLDDPVGDAEVRIAHGDLRLLAVGKFGIVFPGVENREVSCRLGFRYVDGTSDAFESRAHAELQGEIESYAKAYNQKILASSESHE